MIRSYFKLCWRNLWKNKTFSLINIIGLSIGISASLIIFLIVNHDFSFDKFEKDNYRIYRVVTDYNFAGKPFYSSGVANAMPGAAKNEVTGLDIIAPFRTWNDGVKVSVPGVANNDPTVYKKQKAIVFADENYFSLLDYHWLAGSPKTCLAQPYQTVLTEANAKLYFPGISIEQIIGKELFFNDTIRTTISGIVKDLKRNTDFRFKTFISKSTIETTRLKPDDGDEWGSTNSASQLFIKLSPGTATMQVEAQINQIFHKHIRQDPGDHNTTTYRLQALSDLHFNSNYDNFEQRLAHKPTLYGLLAVGVFLLLLACINFINLTTAQGAKRAKEIGVRKTMGSSQRHLIFQFLGETFLLTLAATVLSVSLAPSILKLFADFIPEGIHPGLLYQPGMLLFLLLLVCGVSILSGFYPAIILSSLKPVFVLKNQVSANAGLSRDVRLRKLLTVSQFVIAQLFIIATILVSKQIKYTLNKDLGFKKNAIIYFNTNYKDENTASRILLMNKLKAVPEIGMVCLDNNPPSSISRRTSTLKYKDKGIEIETQAEIKYADTNYLKLYEIKLLAGTNLPYSDTVHSLIINEAYAQTLGFKDPQQAIAKYLEWDGKQNPIVGVVANFHLKSLHESIAPLVIASSTSQQLNFGIALQSQVGAGTNWTVAIRKIEKAFKQVYPGDDFEYSFLDDTIAKYYTAEKNISKLLMWATSLAIVISCLGLLGLVIYVTSQRTKEIGIRKVVGATVVQIVVILSKDFLKLIIIAFGIALPFAWWASNRWLDNFAYRTTVSWWIFLAGGSIMLLLALLVVSIRTIKAAMINPVQSLRTE